MMQRLFDQLVQVVQQGVGAVFRFVQLVWGWSIDQVSTLLHSPWEEWSLAKRAALGLVFGILVYVLYTTAKDLWAAGQTILGAFGTLLNVVIRTLPKVLLAGLIALASAWLLNNLDFSRIYIPQYRGGESGNGNAGNGNNADNGNGGGR
jgi:hypothetical protein